MSPAGRWRADRLQAFYPIAAWSALAVAATGFFLTYALPMARSTFAGPRWAHLHGALLLAWLAIAIAQTHLVRGRLTLHRRLGWSAAALAPLIALSTVLVGAEAARRDIARFGASGADAFVGTITTPLIFLVLVAAALAMRKTPQWHKRLMFLATTAILWPAWFRFRHFLPDLPRPDIWLAVVLAYTPLVIAAVRDRVRFGAVHPAYLTVGLAVVAEQWLEVLLFGTPAWHALAVFLLGRVP